MLAALSPVGDTGPHVVLEQRATPAAAPGRGGGATLSPNAAHILAGVMEPIVSSGLLAKPVAHRGRGGSQERIASSWCFSW